MHGQTRVRGEYTYGTMRAPTDDRSEMIGHAAPKTIAAAAALHMGLALKAATTVAASVSLLADHGRQGT